MSKNKKVLVAVCVLVAIVALFIGLFLAFGPKAQSGSKAITIQVMNKAQETKEYTLKTDAEFLQQAMDETNGLTYEEESGFVNTINGETADWNKDQSYWAIYVNGEYGQYGIASQPVSDGDVYLFQYTIGY